MREGTKACEGKEKFREQLVSTLCGKEHFLDECRPAVSILSATKDEEGERQHLIDRSLRRKNLRQRKVSHIWLAYLGCKRGLSNWFWEPEGEAGDVRSGMGACA